jgi:dTDP-4-dehydrorhamnose reductase
MIKIAITGATGLIGSKIIELLNNKFQFIPLPSSLMDITNKDQVYQILKETNFDLFLHLAAYTNVAKADLEKDLCFKINVEGTKNVFEVVSFKKKKFIYISTDFVFDGKKENVPFFETSIPNPVGFYGETKYQGEKIVKNKGMIVRIAYPYRNFFPKKPDFVHKLKNFLEQKKELKMIKNALMTPTLVDDIAFGLKYLIKNYTPNIFHLVGNNAYSPYDVAKIIAKKFNLPLSLIKETTYEEYIKGRSPFPQYSDIRSLTNNFFPMSDFETGLEKIIRSQK